MSIRTKTAVSTLFIGLFFGFVVPATCNVLQQPGNSMFDDIPGLTAAKTTGLPFVKDRNSNEDGQWIHWDDGENANSVGNNTAVKFSVAARWNPEDIEDYNGLYVTKISFFPNYEDCVYTLKIWIGTYAQEVYSQVVTHVDIAQWNTVALSTPFQIVDTTKLWIGYSVDTKGGYPAGCDAGPAVSGKGNMVYFKNEWNELSSVNSNLDYNWNIQAYVTATLPPTFSNVTFNVNMALADGFDPETHSVFLTGDFTEWATPGTEGAITLEKVEEDRAANVIFRESWDEYPDFATLFPPWITHLVNDDATWSVSEFDFPGEEEPFAFMVFNPSMAIPDVSGTHPAFDGDKYLIAVQSKTVDDNKWLISPSISLIDSCLLRFAAKSITDSYGLERIRVLISTQGTDTTKFVPISEGDYVEVPVEWTKFTFDLSDYDGQQVNIAIQYVSHDALMLMLDNFMVYKPIHELLYTTSLEVMNGPHQYKYFSDAFGQGWSGGEWDGDPNREINVENDMVVNDQWGFPATYFEANILSFEFEEGQDEVFIAQDHVVVWLPEGTNITALTPVISITEGATINYVYPTTMDFSVPVEFTVTAQDGVTTKTYPIYVWTTDVNTQNLVNIKVFPNPFSDAIHLTHYENFNRLVISNIMGQVVLDIPLSTPYISTANFAKGVYIATFYSRNGEKAVFKMVKH